MENINININESKVRHTEPFEQAESNMPNRAFDLGVTANSEDLQKEINEICLGTKSRLKEYMSYYDDNFQSLAEFMGISYQSLSKKLNNHVDFKRTEILMIKRRYNLTPEQVDYIFF